GASSRLGSGSDGYRLLDVWSYFSRRPGPLCRPLDMSISRRAFLKSAGAATLGFAGLARGLAAHEAGLAAAGLPRVRSGGDLRRDSRLRQDGPGFGPLQPDPAELLDLPSGFSYRVFSVGGERMDDGLFVPRRHDGMAAFPAEDGLTLLVRNHEVEHDADPREGAFGPENELLNGFDSGLFFDPGTEDHGPALGGTTNLLYDTRDQRLVEHRLSLVGTLRNCAGGPTPWGTWITCEESVQRAEDGFARDHGYAFEVPAVMPPRLERPEPLRALGRFYREAVAVHPETGIVYQTEDRGDGLFYRFVPETPGDLRAGGRLQALAVTGHHEMWTQNWGRVRRVDMGEVLDVHWVDLGDPENPEDDLRERGASLGAARFARAEGIWYASDGVYIACTNGGEARRGQIWRYRPSPREGSPGETRDPPRLELFLEATRSSLLRRADNLTMAPWGDLVVCEDGFGTDSLVGVTPEGDQYLIARNARSSGELAGSVFSPDGTTLFVNLQREALTVAITGPWERARETS
ncbi:MAG: DUF839 domain-containing protein, partial [Longimicrobiales bacterium]|nr:DUF839 domain-containing protein [Longimicrobiales bacterium]